MYVGHLCQFVFVSLWSTRRLLAHLGASSNLAGYHCFVQTLLPLRGWFELYQHRVLWDNLESTSSLFDKVWITLGKYIDLVHSDV